MHLLPVLSNEAHDARALLVGRGTQELDRAHEPDIGREQSAGIGFGGTRS